MKKIILLGAGKIGPCIAGYLASADDYDLLWLDKSFSDTLRKSFQTIKNIAFQTVELSDQTWVEIGQAYQPMAVISALPYYLNVEVAKVCATHHWAYFDLTEDRAVTGEIARIAKEATVPFVPQCGLAPGWVGIVAFDLMQNFDTVESLRLRVGALPQLSRHPLKYALTWSTEGLINEYINPCEALAKGQPVIYPALEGLESLELNGQFYEAFYTSGGLGRLVALCEGKVKVLDYKTLRYPGHQEKMRFLLEDMGFSENRIGLKTCLENVLPITTKDYVIFFVEAIGWQQGVLTQATFFRRYEPRTENGWSWSAIQWTTAIGVCAVLDHILTTPEEYRGIVWQETLPKTAILTNRFGYRLVENNVPIDFF